MNTVFQANGNRAQRLSLPLGAVPMPPAAAARGLRLTTVLSCILWCYARSMWEHSRHRLTKDDLLFFVIAVVLILFDRRNRLDRPRVGYAKFNTPSPITTGQIEGYCLDG
jgi:hypothetical protein